MSSYSPEGTARAPSGLDAACIDACVFQIIRTHQERAKPAILNEIQKALPELTHQQIVSSLDRLGRRLRD